MEADSPDTHAAAALFGWTTEAAERFQEESDALGEVAVRIVGARPDAFVGSAMPKEPGQGRPTIYIKGEADEEIRALAAHPTVAIDVVEGQPFSATDLDARVRLLARSLEEIGYDNFGTAYDILRRGRLTANIQAHPDLPRAPEAVRAMLPPAIADDVDLGFSEQAVSQPDAVRGGQWTGTSGTPEKCTTGYSVFGRNPRVSQITTAGHCSPVDRIGAVPLTLQLPIGLGSGLDVNHYTTPDVEERTFHPSTNTVGEVRSVEPYHAITINEPVCFYGRASAAANPNFPNCTQVTAKGLCHMPAADGGWTIDVVYTWDYLSKKGDSGGPWYFNWRAFGITYGGCNPNPNGPQTIGAFTPADYFDSRINAGVMARDWLVAGQVMPPGTIVMSEDGRSEFVMQHDGNLVIYHNHVPVWSTLWLGVPMQPGALAAMETDGNLVLWSNGVALWSTGTWHWPGSRIKMQSDGNLVVYSLDWTPRWASNTCCY